jgi:hypothetical protein
VCERPFDGVEHIIGSFEYVHIPEPNDSATMRFEPSGSVVVVPHLRFSGMRNARISLPDIGRAVALASSPRCRLVIFA